MRLSIWTLLIGLFLVGIVLEEEGVGGIPFNAITPNLSTGWFHKPGPTESLLFGLVVLKVLALRMAGVVPYNLNELLAEGSYLDNHIFKTWRRKKASRSQRSILNQSESTFDEFNGEIEILDRILLGLRRIDSHDCFIRHLCQIQQKQLNKKSSFFDDQILQIFSSKRKGTSSLDLYEEALRPEKTSCREKYPLCPLTPKDTSLSSILKGIF